MTEAELLKRVTINPGIFGGKPIIRGMRIAVESTFSACLRPARPLNRFWSTTLTSRPKTFRLPWSTRV